MKAFPWIRRFVAYLTILSAVAAGTASADSLPGDFPFSDGLSAFLEADDAEAGIIPQNIPSLVSGVMPSGLDAIHFDGSANYLEIGSNPDDFDGRGRTTFVVFRTDALDSGRMINNAFTTLNPDDPDLETIYRTHNMFPISNGELRVQNRNSTNGAVTAATSAGAVEVGEFYIGTSLWEESGDGSIAVRTVDGDRDVGTAGGADADPTGHLFTRIGADSEFRGPSPQDHFSGDIAAVLVYNRDLSPAEIGDVEDYLEETYFGEGPEGDDPGQPPVTDGLIVHLNASGIEQDGEGGVTAMLDLSGQGNDAVVASDRVVRLVDRSGSGNDAVDRKDTLRAEKPLLLSGATPAGRNAVSFDGLRGYMDIEANPEDFDGRGNTTFVIFRPRSAGWGERVIGSAYTKLDPSLDESEQSGLRYRAASAFVDSRNSGSFVVQNRTAGGGSVSVATANESVTERQFFLGVNLWRADGATLAIVRNEANDRFAGDTSGADADPEGHLWTRIGADSMPDFQQGFYSGDIAAIVVFNRGLGGFEMLDMEEYLHEQYIGGGAELGGPDDFPVTNGLVAYLRAEDVETTGDRVDRMIDLTGRGNDAVSFIGELPSSAPSLSEDRTPSGRGMVNFAGGGEYLEIVGNPDSFDGQGRTALVVFRPNDIESDHRIINAGFSKTGPADTPIIPRTRTHNMNVESGGWLRVVNRNQANGFNSSTTPGAEIDPGGFYIGVNYLRDDGFFQAVLRNAENERFEREDLAGDGADAILEDHLFTRIGAGAQFNDRWRDGNMFYNGDIAAVVLFTRELSEEELLEMEEYLYHRYLAESELFLEYADWVDQFDLPEGVRGPEADASGDGVTNLENFAFGRDPRLVSREGLPELGRENIDGEEYLTISVSKNPEAASIGYQVEGSVDFSNWSAGTDRVVILEENEQILRARSADPVSSAEKQFLRVRIVLEN